MIFFFFFKQKTAYEMRISDWSSDVCSSDLWPLPFENNVLSGGTWTRGLYERAFVTFIPNIIMKRMNFNELTYEEGMDDPRLPVIAMPTKHGDYRGASMNADAQDAPYKTGETYYPYADDITASLEQNRSEEHTSELQSLKRISYAAFCLK